MNLEKFKEQAREYEGPAADFRMEQSVVPLEHVDHLIEATYQAAIEEVVRIVDSYLLAVSTGEEHYTALQLGQAIKDDLIAAINQDKQ
jgi:hypothetical protein